MLNSTTHTRRIYLNAQSMVWHGMAWQWACAKKDKWTTRHNLLTNNLIQTRNHSPNNKNAYDQQKEEHVDPKVDRLVLNLFTDANDGKIDVEKKYQKPINQAYEYKL